MTTRSNGPAAGFGWLTRGIDVARRHPGPLLGGAALLLVACLLPSLATLPFQMRAMQPGAQPGPALFGGMMLLSMLIALLLVPLYAGYLQVIDAAERGQRARARDIFKPYVRGQALRLIGYALLMMVVCVALVAVVLVVTGGGLASWYMQAMAAQANHLPPPGLPAGFMTAFALFSVLWLFMMGFYAISLGQVSLGNRGVFASIGDGVVGALKNALPLLVFALSMLLVWVVATIAIVLLVLVVTLLAKLVGMWLVFVLAVPLYIAMILVLYAMMFGVMYHLWRDVCGDAEPPTMATAAA
ncbi:hypothetical protein [Frateuria soli]|uniref:hypothetical protein n=1 Tax=Frateuria soli TaxID=1542730 RepID=UPI001E40D131|nr:hypothetical protein [Frateuria soli]UGB37673.1 hypothetical protein LQ771_12690 [Frateuria soli]